MKKERRFNKLDEMSKETRRRILVESTRLFASQGYHRTTMADIAAAIGKTQGAIFHQFASKEDILNAVVERLARGFKVYSDAIKGAGQDDPFGAVLQVMTVHFKRQPEATVCLAALATEFAGSGAPILEKIRKVYDSFVDPFAEVLSGRDDVTDPKSAAIAFIGAVQGIAIQGLLRKDDPPMEALAGAFREMTPRGARPAGR